MEGGNIVTNWFRYGVHRNLVNSQIYPTRKDTENFFIGKAGIGIAVGMGIGIEIFFWAFWASRASARTEVQTFLRQLKYWSGAQERGLHPRFRFQIHPGKIYKMELLRESPQGENWEDYHYLRINRANRSQWNMLRE